MLSSPITPFIFKNNFYHIKRDDLLKPFEGNKARKFYYFYKNEFPNIKRVISFGSNQSNAMYSLSKLCKLKGWEFIYFTNHIPSLLKNNPHGNYLGALKNGAKIIEIDLKGDELRHYVLSLKDKNCLIIEEGGRIKESEYGIKLLAQEINDYCKKNDLKVFLPSGTGTTAYFLAKHLEVEVLTVACVGNEEYLKRQWSYLSDNQEIKNLTILPPRRKYHFGKLYKNLYDIWKELKFAGIEFDLLYDPIGWDTILFHDLKNILYIHQGGLQGNFSMLKRYQRKYD
ncbi:1-aminocyclopropane-1-carboxylate deaminase/D-cysteine desulfhydrase [Caminibacter pacificus]|uniref:1-aminocyclopropane-1-carboxylate deaminase/D-cysteine desulfhydrase n=1 Tax=Caminibacter pacificus TaxID=1424653 RepID=A0AAJ4UYB4_9BACT|nr:1-aminocyclopropane-1-carboxylate deaminase/D-cysteine desulfhydrase [Caminibacter pacificus]NPA87075.1 1-aminocyclopropane-1-carboxylate deaminase/D-cysteine desulfhydrase [Campylobacterota bacterium]QCI28717.1 1-aminocyclopropane-1-carboxylate deaminase/D-cysteine desulfhydrase [Caminibacter pacificus]ROR40549.1 1-aminocyclopropane-1-carboxylate deaminase/D-cysteine desulfhydrase-like pyridoxal-dependent ACC family enzyme [Caminibacter pacificus]